MNLRLLLFALVSAFTTFMISIPALSQDNHELTKNFSSASTSPKPVPSVNPIPTTPLPPPGPTWMPYTGEIYRKKLEQFRLNLEDYRKDNPMKNINEYTSGITQYREGIKLYKDSIQQIQK